LDAVLVVWIENCIDYYTTDGEWAECMDNKIRVFIEDIDKSFPAIPKSVAVHANELAKAKEQGIYSTGVAGRPSSKGLARLQMHRRASEGRLCGGLAEEMRDLLEWLKQSHPGAPIPTPKTLANALRHEYRKLKGSAKSPT
jgi:hypothetical protein